MDDSAKPQTIERSAIDQKDLLLRLSKQHGAQTIGEPCSRWVDAIEAKYEIIKLQEELNVLRKLALALNEPVQPPGGRLELMPADAFNKFKNASALARQWSKDFAG